MLPASVLVKDQLDPDLNKMSNLSGFVSFCLIDKFIFEY